MCSSYSLRSSRIVAAAVGVCRIFVSNNLYLEIIILGTFSQMYLSFGEKAATLDIENTNISGLTQHSQVHLSLHEMKFCLIMFIAIFITTWGGLNYLVCRVSYIGVFSLAFSTNFSFNSSDHVCIVGANILNCNAVMLFLSLAINLCITYYQVKAIYVYYYMTTGKVCSYTP